MLLSLATLAYAECSSSRIAATELKARIERAERAYVEMDESGFARSHDEVVRGLNCLDEPISPALAAAWHRNDALAAFLAGDESRTISSLQAASRIAAANAISETLAPRGTELRTLADRARSTLSTATRSLPATGWVDGTRTNRRPESVPTIVQFAETDGRIRWTGYLRPNQEPPAMAVPSESKDKKSASAQRWDTRRGQGVYYGFEVGLPIGGRIDYKFDGGPIDSAGGRFGFVPGIGPTGYVIGLGALATGDYRLSEIWQIEASAGVMTNFTGSAFLVGAAAQLDPPSAFQLNLGALLSYWSGTVYVHPDITAGFVF